jgi:hypothetical protein
MGGFEGLPLASNPNVTVSPSITAAPAPVVPKQLMLLTLVGSSWQVATPWAMLMGSATDAINISTEANARISIPMAAGTFKNLSVNQQNNGDAATTITLRQNGADSALTVTLPLNTAGIVSDNVHTVPVTAGDLIDYHMTGAGGAMSGWITIEFDPA